MTTKLTQIYEFLSKNKIYNKDLHERFYGASILPFDNPEDRLITLLYKKINTQSQPKIDWVASFFIDVYANPNCLQSFNNFLEKVSPGSESTFENLFLGLSQQKGWGNKTAALFVKDIYNIHGRNFNNKLKIWNDVPVFDKVKDRLYLPVDSVILAIFNKLDNNTSWNFDKINKYLFENFNDTEMQLWDDLWFWGFFTQKGSGDKRTFEWNPNKYWALPESDKNAEVISRIREFCLEFIRLIN